MKTILETISSSTREVVLKGWVKTVRKQGGIIFLILRDRSAEIQIVVPKDRESAYRAAKALSEESVLKVVGEIKEVESVPEGIEVLARDIEVLSKAEVLPIPITDKTDPTGRPKRMDYRWIDLRDRKKRLIFQIWTTAERAYVDYMVSRGFIRIHTPHLMSAASESKSELFELDYFGEKAYLSQSCQFYKQMAMAAGFERVYEMGPVFRANKAFTSRHDTEFTQYDMEISFIESYEDVIKHEVGFIRAIIEAVRERHGAEIMELFEQEVDIPDEAFPVLTLQEVKQKLKHLNIPTARVGDLSPEEEREIYKIIKEDTGHDFLFVTEYPYEQRAFYHMRSDDGKLTKGFDLIYKGVEITTGAQREHRTDILLKQAEEAGVSKESISTYLDFFRFGCPPHGGLGFGISRFLMQMLGLQNVREVTYLYRGVKRLDP